ncbi:hypothetical protein, partial [Salmonella enterica]|uniref:hypothetical protein n=1 Tax=Salmonella enterica TaxID=28901 RepID=UPI0020C3E82C
VNPHIKKHKNRKKRSKNKDKNTTPRRKNPPKQKTQTTIACGNQGNSNKAATPNPTTSRAKRENYHQKKKTGATTRS